MNLTSLRKSYSNLLESFKEAGVTLNESQMGNLDQFMVSLEKKLTETRDAAIRTTKKMVTEKLDAEYRTLTESLIKHMQENAELTAKIQKKVDESKKTNEIAEAVDEYLDLYVEELIPAKTIVDYARMQKLERIQESLKEMLTVSEADIKAKSDDQPEAKSEENTEVPAETPTKDDSEKVALEAKVDELQKKLDTSIKNENELTKKVDKLKAEQLLESKTRDLPEREAKIIRESLKNASVSEIKMKFRTLLESAREDINSEVEQEQEKSLEEAISDIINTERSSNENNDGNTDEGTDNPDISDIDPETDDGTETGLEQSEDTVVDESYMKYWMSRC